MEPIAEAFSVSITELISGDEIKNTNVSANMMRSLFYVCPVCGNVIHSMGEAAVHCHGVLLKPAQAEQTDENHKITEFQEKPEHPKSNLASMGIYIFSWPVLRDALIKLKDQPNCDFGMHVIPYVHENGKLPVVNFAAGGVATPADAALMMQLGAEGVFVGSGIFKSGNPAKRAAAIVKAVANFTDAKLIAELSEDLGEAMVGINEQEIELLMAERGK